MTKKQYLLTLCAVLKAKFLGKGTPLIINWAITYKCNNQCNYCKVWQQNVPELPTGQVFKLIDLLHKKNTVLINFTGGEPLMRVDISDILSYVAKEGIGIVLSTNGLLLREKESVLDNVQLVKLSFDGPLNIHDGIRGKGSFAKVMQAIKIVKQSKARLLLCSVLSRYNLDSIDYILNMAKKLNSPIFFQPATEKILGSFENNPAFFEINAYCQAITKLLRLKKTKSLGKYIANSATGLKYLYNWPDVEAIRCAAGLIFGHISADGYLMRCARNSNSCELEKLNVVNDFSKSFGMLKNYKHVPCLCPGMLECNYLFDFNLDAAANLIKLIF